MSDFRGARASNTGDDYHELWATRHALRLLDPRDPLQALAVEGLAPIDEAGAPATTWDGVDCTLYENGDDARDADRIVLEQLKYSPSGPDASWTVARLCRGDRREKSVLNRLARAWSGIQARGPKAPVEVVLVTNQRISPALEAAREALAAGGVAVPRKRPADDAPDTAMLAYAAGLKTTELPRFAAALRFEGTTGSRYAIEEKLLADMTAWTDLELLQSVSELRRFIRNRMRPEFAGEPIYRESVLLGLGFSSIGALFPCPPELKSIAAPVARRSVAEAADRLLGGSQRLCLHGPGGIGKTTALQQIESALPARSVMVTFDCYGAGSYLDADALRHRPADAFLQLSNELAVRLRLPILLGRQQAADPPRMFAHRLRHAARSHAAEHPDALIVIAVDAADNSVTAATTHKPPETSFVQDFVRLGDIPENVRLVVTARTGRLPEIALPPGYETHEIRPFTRAETAEHVRRTWPAPSDWLDGFHELTGGLPRVQAYAMDLGEDPPEMAIDRLLPSGRSLDQVFREQFERALAKSGDPSDLTRFCAGLIALARPVPLDDLSAVLGVPVPVLSDICIDMMPAIRVSSGRVRFADEDFEHFVRAEGASVMAAVQQGAADWLLARSDQDAYAAQHVAGALVAAGRGSALLDLVERDPSPAIVADPVLRREAELTRLRLAISVCREAGDTARALRFVLIGGEGLKTERALRALLRNNPDLAVRFAADTAGRLILTDPREIGWHGAFLLHRQAVHAAADDRISLREGRRLVAAWMSARKEASGDPRGPEWRLETEDVAAGIEATLRSRGGASALGALRRWRPKRIQLDVARRLVPKLLAEGRADLLEAVLDTGMLRPWQEPFLLVPMAMAGRRVDRDRLAAGLADLLRRRFSLGSVLRSRAYAATASSHVLDVAMSAVELLARNPGAAELVDGLLVDMLRPANRSIAIHDPTDARRLDLLFRAHALKAARDGRIADTATIYEPRPETTDKEELRRRAREEDDADRKLNEVAASVFGVYAARATALVGPPTTDVESVTRLLDGHARRREDEAWRFSGTRGAAAMAATAAHSLLLLLATDADHRKIAEVAVRLHGRWGDGDLSPDEAFAGRLALRPALHDGLVRDADASARSIRGRRMGAQDKAKALVAYARMLLPVSPADANEVFNDAVAAASELDHEIVPQLKLIASLLKIGLEQTGDRRSVARNLSEIMADAAIRLEGHEGLPWNEVMETIAALDLPLALANAAKWEDADLARYGETLPATLKAGLNHGTLPPASAMALDLLLHGDHGVTEDALRVCSEGGTPHEPFIEEAAWDSLIRHDHRGDEKLAARMEGGRTAGRWAKALTDRQEFLSRLPDDGPLASHARVSAQAGRGQAVPAQRIWNRETLIDGEALDGALTVALTEARAAERYVSTSEILGEAAAAVVMRDRVAFLDAVSTTRVGIGSEMTDTLLVLLDSWSSPAIRNWAATRLPDVIVARFTEFVGHMAYGETSLPRALERTRLPPAGTVDLLLRGVQLHGDALGGDQVFALAGLIAGSLDAKAVSDAGGWYAARLAGRIAPEDRDQIWDPTQLPATVPAAVARLLHACLGDHDVRVRWRAVYAIRRLARLAGTETLEALISEYGRKDETVFRSPDLAFYWIAARLYFTVAWNRVAGEMPETGAIAGSTLLAIARDARFPHVLLRSLARDACLELVRAGRLPLTGTELDQLKLVGRSTLPVQPEVDERNRGPAPRHDDEGRRFRFDTMDTIPYWYVPTLSGFAKASLEQLLRTAERWILDRWGYPGDIRAFDAERRRGRFRNHEWSLTSNRHGSNPILERLNTHLEWHALWCATGELMETEPLSAQERGGWNDLEARIAREMLTEPPLWSGDLRDPTPLRPDFWTPPSAPLAEWADGVREDRMRAELAVSDRPGYLIVGGGWRSRSSDRVETVSFSSALVQSEAAPALLRALQTIESAFLYALPHEGEHDLDQGDAPYRLFGWLRSVSSDGGIDAQDPLRGGTDLVDLRPGRRVRDVCGLRRDPAGTPSWSAPDRLPMFLYESWGDRETDEERHSTDFKVSGRRLLVERGQLQEFLGREALELVIEVEIRREGRDDRRRYDQEEKTPEEAYDRLYRLDGTGGLHTAEGRVGAWTGDR